MTKVTALARAMVGVLGLLGGGCANPTATLVILQNQAPAVDSMTGVCVASADPGSASLAMGEFDIALDKVRPYFVYPLIENRLPSIMTAGVERNRLSLLNVHVEIKSPSGINPGWDPGCPGSFDWPAAGSLDPAQLRTVSVEGFQSCHAQKIRDLIALGFIPADLSQPVFFTLELSAVADRSGGHVFSDPFRFSVRVCAGCLQSMFPDTPLCSAAPKPNPFPGNPCNIAQDGPEVLCCFDPNMTLICPAPNQ